MDNIEELKSKLARKEQECEDLKKKLKSLEYTVVLQGNRDIDNAVDLFAKRITKIENENSILKAELEQEKTLKEMYFTYYKAKHSDIKGEFFKLKSESKKLKQALTKIKEIAEKQCICGVECIDMKQILQLISEVEDES